MDNTNKSYFFLIFIIIGVSAIAVIPSLKKSFSKASDTFIMEEMRRVQTDMFYYELDHGSFNGACISGDFVMLQNKILLDSGAGLSCTTDKNKSRLSLYTKLSTGDTYCVDSEGEQGIVHHKLKPTGRCSN